VFTCHDGRKRKMKTLTQSIEAGVPAAFANEEWTEFMFRSFYSERPAARDEFGEGTVRFEPAGERSTKVTVEVQYEPAEEAASGDDLERAREHLGRTLEGYRSFVVQRCEETNC
jgi:hypothetical protein